MAYSGGGFAPPPSLPATKRSASVKGRNKPMTIIEKEIGYSATVNTLLLDISKIASEQEGAVKTGDISEVRVQNTGDVGTWAMFRYAFWSAAATDGGADYLVHHFLLPNDEIRLPAIRAIIGDAGVEPYAGTVITDRPPDSNEYTDSTANLDSATADGIVGDASDDTVYLEPYTSAANCTANLFRIGDLIRVDDEIMEVTGIGTKAALATNTLTVKRGMYGSTAATDGADTDPIRLPFFNAYHDFDRYTVAQTDGKGRFKAMNFFGYGRALTALQGLVPSSVAIQFYESGYQGLTGKSDITANTETGLSVSTAYYLNVAADGGSALEITFTTDSSNSKFGGSTGLIAKIQSALDTAYYTAGNLFEKKVTVGLENGDVVFRSASRLTTSAIALTAGTSGASAAVRFLAQANGRIPALANIPAAVAARLTPEQVYDPITYAATYKDIFIRDDGRGNLFSNGLGSGKINYETGAFDITGCPPNAEFVVSLIHTSAFSGKIDSVEATKQNSLQAVYGNIPSQKKSGSLKVTTY